MSSSSRNPAELRLRSGSAAETRGLARGLAAALCEKPAPPGLAIALVGALGAGKTLFAKGLGEELGLAPEHMASPTFTIANEFALPPGRPFARLVHADFYRMEAESELEAAGLLDWLAPGALLVAEWADRFPNALPADHLEVRLETAADAEAGAAATPGAVPTADAAAESADAAAESADAARVLCARAGGGAARRVLLRWAARCP